MAATFLTLKKRVQYFAAQSGTTDSIDSYSFNDFLPVSINRALERIQRDHLWEALYTIDTTSIDTVASTKTITLPSNLNILKSIVIEDTTNSRQLEITDRHTFNEDIPYPEGEAVDIPTHAIRNGRLTVELYPIPDAIYDVWVIYYKWAAELSSDSDTCDIPHIDDVLEAGGMVEVCQAKELLESKMLWEGIYQQRLREAKRQDKRRPEYFTSPRPYTAATAPPGNFWAKPFWSG